MKYSAGYRDLTKHRNRRNKINENNLDSVFVRKAITGI